MRPDVANLAMQPAVDSGRVGPARDEAPSRRTGTPQAAREALNPEAKCKWSWSADDRRPHFTDTESATLTAAPHRRSPPPPPMSRSPVERLRTASRRAPPAEPRTSRAPPCLADQSGRPAGRRPDPRPRWRPRVTWFCRTQACTTVSAGGAMTHSSERDAPGGGLATGRGTPEPVLFFIRKGTGLRVRDLLHHWRRPLLHSSRACIPPPPSKPRTLLAIGNPSSSTPGQKRRRSGPSSSAAHARE